MNTFVQNFILNHKSSVLTSTKGVITNQYQKINEALTRYKQQLLESNPRYDSLICALTQDPSFISDDMLSQGRREIVDCLSATPIGTEDAENMYNGVIEAITNNGNSDEYGITITDAKGRCYNIIDATDEHGNPKVINGNKIWLSSSLVPSSLGEAILYQDANDNYYFNNVIRTADFVKRNGQLVPQNDELGKLITCCFVAEKVTPTKLLDGLLSLLSDPSGVTDIMSAAHSWSVENSVTIREDCIFNALTDMEAYYISQWSAPGKGSFTSIWSVISDLIESSTLNTAIVSTIQAVQSFGEFSIDYFTTLKDKIGTKYNSVKEFFTGARDAFLRGGFTGLGTYILSYVKAISSLVNDDGLVSFSDNKDLVPQQYIAGLVFNIISAVVTVIGVIVSIFSRVIGIAITVLGGILGAIAQAVTADATDQYASMQLTDSVMLPIAPYALFQMKVDTVSIDSAIRSLFINGAELVAQEVPGGYVIIGPSSVDKDMVDLDGAEYWEKYPECIYKFYPSIVPHNRNKALKNMLSSIDNVSPIFTFDQWDSGHPFTVRFNKDCVYQWLQAHGDTPDYISQLYVNAAEDVSYRNADDGHIKDATSIQLMNDTLMQNITWFIMWTISSRGALSQWVSEETAEPYNNVRAELYADDDATSNYCWPIPYCCADDHFYHFSDGTHVLGSFISGDTAWAELAHYAVSCSKYPSVKVNPNSKPQELRLNINKGWGVDDTVEVPSRMTFAIKTPKYDPDTFWFWVVFSAIVLMAVTVVAVVATVKAKKAINRKRAQNQAAVEKAWDNLKNDPSSANYDAYRKTVKRNNRWATLIGGTKYDYVNYWNGDTSSTNDGSTRGNILSGLDSGESSLNPFGDSNAVITDKDTDIIKKLIAGEV